MSKGTPRGNPRLLRRKCLTKGPPARVFELIRGVYFAHLPHPAWQAKISSALEAVSLNPGDVLGKYPHQLSGGQQQRLLIARALLLDVRLLV